MHQTASKGPHQELFIYYLRGRLTLRNQIFQNNFIGNWEEEEDSFLFFSSSANHQVDKLLQREPQVEYVDRFTMPYEQWLGEVFSTFEHGIFRVIPPWEIPGGCFNAFTDKHQIMLDPGLIFGTGTHPTTRDCLEALELAAGAMQFSTVLDLGTGTGLLALAAARLGSPRVIGVDLNFLAAGTAHRNVRLNRLEDRVMIAQGRAEETIAYPADFIIANIHYDVMQKLISTKEFSAKKRFILSGLMRSEAKEIAYKLERKQIKILKRWTHNGVWHTFYAKMNSKAAETQADLPSVEN